MADILSQDEVDLLLSAVSEGEVSAAPEGQKEVQHKASVYDFRRPNRISKEQYRGLQVLLPSPLMCVNLQNLRTILFQPRKATYLKRIHRRETTHIWLMIKDSSYHTPMIII